MNANSLKNLKPMKKGETRNPNGRPRKLLTIILKELSDKGYTQVKPFHVTEAYETLLGLPRVELEELILNEDAPMILRIIGKKMLSPKGDEIIERMLDRVHGRPKQNFDSINHNIDVNAAVDDDKITDIERAIDVLVRSKANSQE